MSQSSIKHAKLVVSSITDVQSKIMTMIDHARINIKDAELITKLTSLNEQAGNIAKHINSKVDQLTG